MDSTLIHPKNVTILTNGGGELANQLSNYLSIYAYALHTGAHISNPSFFEYHKHFRFIQRETLTTKFFSFWFQGPIRRRGHPINTFWRRVYKVYTTLIRTIHPDACISTQNNDDQVFFLPPTKDTVVPATRSVYFLGWLFRNPEGLAKYRDTLREAFRPVTSIEERVETLIRSLRMQKHLIGVHIRQSDYAGFKNGTYIVPPIRMREVVDEYLQQRGFSINDTTLIVTSDGLVDDAVFEGYTVHLSKENAVTDLFLLSRTDVIIGSNSSFGHFASWFGNIPHIIGQNGPMDWEYYAGKEEYFPTKYATLVRLS
jgi:hypothetical protein